MRDGDGGEIHMIKGKVRWKGGEGERWKGLGGVRGGEDEGREICGMEERGRGMVCVCTRICLLL